MTACLRLLRVFIARSHYHQRKDQKTEQGSSSPRPAPHKNRTRARAKGKAAAPREASVRDEIQSQTKVGHNTEDNKQPGAFKSWGVTPSAIEGTVVKPVRLQSMGSKESDMTLQLKREERAV